MHKGKLPPAKATALSKAIKSALCLSLAPGLVAAQSDDVSDAVMETITVTGSRIPRLDPQLVTPVQIYDADFIAATGAGNIQDFLFTSSFAGPNLFNENQTLSQTAGTANFDSRGFGDDYVVILLNGRRLPADPLGGDSATNLNLIPIGSVDRIEYLSTGASAIYGADAVQGVINVITKQNYEGLDMSVRYGDTSDSDGHRIGLALTGGIVSDKGFATVSFEFQNQMDVSADGLPLIGSASAPGADGRSPTGLPGSWLDFGGPWVVDVNDSDGDGDITDIVAGDRLDADGNVVLTGAEWSTNELWVDQSVPAVGCPDTSLRSSSYGLGGLECAFDFAPLYDAVPAQNRYNFLANAEYNFGEAITAYGEFRFSRNVTKVRNGAAPAFFFLAGAPILEEVDATYGTNMATSPYVYMARRSVDAGPRATDNTNTAFSTVLGSRIELSNNAELDISVQNVESEMNRIGVGGQISRSGLTDAVVSGLMDPRILYDKQFYADNGLSLATQRQATGSENTLNLQLTGEFGGSGIGYALGTQFKDRSFDDLADVASSTGDVAGGASSNGNGESESQSLFAEFAYSPTDRVEMSLAARYDDYTWEGLDTKDGDSATTYMAGVSFRPIDSLLLRASYGTGFKAPTLGELFLGRSFGVNRAVDTTVCNQVTNDPTSTDAEILNACRILEIRSVSGGNPLLTTESSDNYSVGMVWEPTDSWSIALDYYSIEVEDKIGALSTQEILNNEADFPELVTRINGALTCNNGCEVRSNNQNLFEENGQGIDLSTRGSWDAGSGSLIADVRVAYLLEHERQSSAVQPLCDDTGTTSEPEWRVNGQFGFEAEKNWTTTLTFRYLGSTIDLPGGRDSANFSCDVNPGRPALDVDSYLEFGLRGTYTVGDGTEIALGIINLTDEEPPFSEVASGGWPWFDQSLYDARGTRFYMNVTHDFF
jgi:iron complex outermembrane receptor protein